MIHYSCINQVPIRWNFFKKYNNIFWRNFIFRNQNASKKRSYYYLVWHKTQFLLPSLLVQKVIYGILGVRLLEEFDYLRWFFDLNRSGIYSQILDLMAWARRHVFQKKSYWLMVDSPRLSHFVRSMIKQKHLFMDFIRCEIRNWRTTSFLFDSWTTLGLLMAFTGQSALGVLQLRQLDGDFLRRDLLKLNLSSVS